MLALTHHKAERDNKQEVELSNYLWETEVLPQLPPDLEEQAKKHQALQRKREIGRAADLLRGLLGYALAGLSTRQWGAWALIIDLADISSQAWSKRLQKSGQWLSWLWNALVSPGPLATSFLKPTLKRILLVDATRLKQLGGNGDDWRLHLAYDLLAGQMAQVKVTDQSQGEQLAHFELQPGDLVVTDRGYGHRFSVAVVKQAGAEGLFRIHPDKCLLQDETGQRLDVWRLLQDERQKGQLWDVPAFCTDDQQRYAVRLIAAQLPQEQADLARKRLKDKARKKGETVSAKQLKLAGWVLLVTTLAAEEWPAADLVRLYRARWQIELLFKRMKQMLRMHQINCKRPDSVQATIWALLVAWLLQEQQATAVRHQLEQARQAAQTKVTILPAFQPVSHWSLNKLCLQVLKNQVLGQWSMARLRACIPRLLRFLTSIQRKRLHQETDVRFWLERLLTQQSSEPLNIAA